MAQAKGKKTKSSGKTTKKRINLALQGGGAHGAFTWGVLDRILEDDRLQIEAITGTSAGAMNGAVAVYGLLTEGPQKARTLLTEFWRKVSLAAHFSPLQPTILDRMMGNHNLDMSPNFYALDFFTRMFSPYQYNFLDLNPLKVVVQELINFETIRNSKTVKLFVNATHVRSGKLAVFRTEEMTIDMLMASACLPFLFKTVYVNGEPYWDGGYSGNPALHPLFYECHTPDVVIVQINPLYVEAVPTTATEILDRVNEISFNSNLLREMRAIDFVKRLLDENRIPDTRYTDVRVHVVEAEALMSEIGTASKFNADWDFLKYLRDIGYKATDEWLENHYDDIGKRSSVDIKARYL